MEFFIHQDIPDDPTLKHPVFVTNTEADHYLSFENQTIATIDREIVELIETIGDTDKKSTYQEKFRRDILRKKKAVHLDFFAEVQEVLNEQNGPAVLSDNEDSDDNQM